MCGDEGRALRDERREGLWGGEGQESLRGRQGSVCVLRGRI